MSKQSSAPSDSGTNSAVAPQSSGVIGKVTILALVVAVILGECLAAFFFLGHSEPASAAGTHSEAPSDSHAPKEKEKASHHAPSKSTHHGGGHGHGHGSSSGHHADHKEVDLGEYSIMATDPASSTMLLVDFHIFGTISSADQHEFDRRYEENRHRIRHQVIISVRSAEMPDLTDASLGLIRRQILEKTNQLLGKPLVEEIIFSKFSFIEQ